MSDRQLNLRKTPATPRQDGVRTPISTPRSVGPASAGVRHRLRRELFQGSSLVGTPGWKSDTEGCLTTPRKYKPVPEKYKQQMPTSARKKAPEPEPPSNRFSPIVKTSFYGAAHNSSLSSHNSSMESSSLSPPLKRQPLKPKNSNKDKKADPLRSKAASKHRGKVSKVKKTGFNKGVSHAIKKPSKKLILKKIKQREDRLKKERLAKLKEGRIKSSSSEFKKSFFEGLVDDDKAANRKARRSGKISMSKQTNVSYEIKNGQPVFHLRRSPRKCYLNEEKTTVNRTTPKLFTPSGSDDYLGGSSPVAKKRRVVPSPIKFDHQASAANDEAELDKSVRNIIDTLGDDSAEADRNVSQDDYAMYVTDDELAKAAMEATHEISNIQDPPEDTQETIQNILMQMAPITQDDIDERRQVSKTTSESKHYPVFERMTRSRTATPTKKNPRLGHTSTTGEDKDGKKQMVIDAGQKVIGAQYCLICDFVYTAGCVDEEKLHDEKHAQVAGKIKFTGWRNEDKIDHLDGRIVIVKPNDPKRHWEKVEAVLGVVDSLLGIAPASGTQCDQTEANDGGSKVRNRSQSQAYMFVADNRVVGMLFAEILDKTDVVSVSSLQGDQQRVLRDISKKKRAKISVGIAKIWVSPDYQRKGIASRLADAVRSRFLLPARVLDKDEIAFSHTTPSGSEFASNYVGSTDFLTYAPALAGVSQN